MIDGEGSVSLARTGGVMPRGTPRRGKRSVRIANTDRDIIDAVCAAYDELEIVYWVTGSQPRGDARYRYCWEVVVSQRASLEKILAVVPIRSRKRALLEQAVASYRFPAVPAHEELHRLYVEDELSLTAVGERLGVKPQTVLRWLEVAGIPRRSLSEAMLIHRAKQRTLAA